MRQYISYSYTSRKPMIKLGGKYFLIEFGVPMKLARQIKMCLNKTHNKVKRHKHLPNNIPIQNYLKGDDLLPLLFNFTLE
jgi:hypothetical protein